VSFVESLPRRGDIEGPGTTGTTGLGTRLLAQMVATRETVIVSERGPERFSVRGR